MAKIIPINNGTKKEIIIKKASLLFKKSGFSATSMRELAEAIGIEAPSLYNHVTSKKEILQEICFKMGRLFTAHINHVEKIQASALQKLDLILRFHIHMMLEEFEGVYISNHEWKHLPEPFLSNFKSKRKNYQDRLVNIIKHGINKKEIKKIDPYVAVLTMLSAIGGIENWHRSNKKVDAKSLEENMISILLQGLKNELSVKNQPLKSNKTKIENQSAFRPV